MRLRPPRNAWGGALATVVVAGCCAANLAPPVPALALVNETRSLPEGLFLRSPDQRIRRGAVVALIQPSAARGYLASLAWPRDVRLLKRVAATGGDRVCARDGRLRWPGGAVVAHRRDRRGVALPVWSDCRRLRPEEVLVMGDTAASFDSRYFGPVRRTSISGVYRQALRW